VAIQQAPTTIYELSADQLPHCDNLAIQRLFDPKNPPPEQQPISSEKGLFELANLIQEFSNIDCPGEIGFYINDTQIKALPIQAEDINIVLPALRTDLNQRLSEKDTEQLLTFFDTETSIFTCTTHRNDLVISENLFGLSITDVLNFGLQKMGLTNVFIVGFGRYEGDKREWHINNNKYKNKITLTQKTTGFLVMINEGEKPEDEEYFKYFCSSIGFDPSKSEKSGHWKIQEINCMAASETYLTEKGFKQHAYRSDTAVFIDAIKGQKYTAEPEKKPKPAASWWNILCDWVVQLWKMLTCCSSPPEKKLPSPSITPKTIADTTQRMSTFHIAKKADISPRRLLGSLQSESELRAPLIPKPAPLTAALDLSPLSKSSEHAHGYTI
jgi:hypothetical protein